MLYPKVAMPNWFHRTRFNRKSLGPFQYGLTQNNHTNSKCIMSIQPTTISTGHLNPQDFSSHIIPTVHWIIVVKTFVILSSYWGFSFLSQHLLGILAFIPALRWATDQMIKPPLSQTSTTKRLRNRKQGS